MKKKITAIFLAVVLVLTLGLVTAVPVAASPDSIFGLWHLDEGSGAGTVADSSGNGNTGTVYGATTGVAGKFGNALSFDGIYTGVQAGGDYVFVPNPSSLHITDKLTVEAWIKPTGIPDRWYGDVVRLGLGYELCLRGDGKLEIALYRSGAWGGWWKSNTAIPIPASSFYYVAFTYDKDGGANNLKIYINGALDAQYTVGSAALQSSGDFWISPWFWPFEGLIDEVRIWNEALTGPQIAESASLGDLELTKELVSPVLTDTNFNGIGEVPIDTYVEFTMRITVDNESSLTLNDAWVKDRLGAELELDEGLSYLTASPGIATFYLSKGKSAKVFIDWDIDDYLTAKTIGTLDIEANTDINPGGGNKIHQEYTSPDIYELNSGPTLTFYVTIAGENIYLVITADGLWVEAVGIEED